MSEQNWGMRTVYELIFQPKNIFLWRDIQMCFSLLNPRLLFIEY